MSGFPTKVTEDEKRLMAHISRWGSDGYPIVKTGRYWHWQTFCGVKGSPTVYRRKRDAFAAFERWMDLKREQLGEEARDRALAERAARDAENERTRYGAY